MPTSSLSAGGGAPPQSPGRKLGWAARGVSIVNAVVGDRLRERQNGLAIDMAFYHQGRPLPLTRESLSRAFPQATAKVCILVHGLACHEGVWDFALPDQPDQVTSYGALLQADLGYTPLFVRYNTGVGIVENGHRLGQLVDDLLTAYLLPVDEIVLIGHSMGGLVIRSAGAWAVQAGLTWPTQVRHVIYLGTPHTGAPLAQLGHTAMKALHAVNGPITRLLGNVLNGSSQGVKDLIWGADGTEREAHFEWLPGVQHYLIVGTLSSNEWHPISTLLGDGLVRLPEARGDDVILAPGAHHMRLTGDWDVYERIRALCLSD